MPECGSRREKVMTSKLEITYYNSPWDCLCICRNWKKSSYYKILKTLPTIEIVMKNDILNIINFWIHFNCSPEMSQGDIQWCTWHLSTGPHFHSGFLKVKFCPYFCTFCDVSLAKLQCKINFFPEAHGKGMNSLGYSRPQKLS